MVLQSVTDPMHPTPPSSPTSRSLALPMAGFAVVGIGSALVLRDRSLPDLMRVLGPEVLGIYALGAALSLRRARTAAPEAAGWGWLCVCFLAGSCQALLIALLPSFPGLGGKVNALWIGLACLHQAAGVAAMATWPWEVRNARQRPLHILGSILFCGSLLLLMRSATHWDLLQRQANILDAVSLTASVRVALFGGLSMYLLADRPARWRGPLGWIFLNAVCGGAFLAFLYPFWVRGVVWMLIPVYLATLAAGFMLFLAAYGSHPVEPGTGADKGQTRLWEYLPYGTFMLAAVVTVAHLLARPEEARTGVLALVLLLVPLLWRQILLYREVQLANQNLEARVELRTRDLEAARTQLLLEIAERRRAEEAQKRDAVHLRTLLDTLPDLVWLKDTQGVYLACNRRFQHFFGASEAEITGRTDYDFVDRETADAFRGNDRRALALGGPTSNEERVTFKGDGHQEDLETIKTPVFGPDHEVLGVLGIGRDITGRKRAEAALRLAFAAVEQSAASIAITDTDGRIEYLNSAFTAATGYTAREMLGQTHGVLKSGEHSEAFYRQLWDTLRAGDTWRGRFHNRNKAGQLFWEQAVISPVRDGSGRITNFVSSKENITEALQMEEARRLLEQQVIHSQKLESLGSLAGGVAHDMNNVLGAILALASSNLDRLEEADPLHRTLDTIARAASRGGDMVRSLLRFAHQTPAEEREVDLNAVLREVAQLLRSTTLARIHTEFELEPGLRPILGDAGALAHSIMNLCVNAVDAMPGGGTLTLRTRNGEGGAVEAEVADTGTGMTDDVRRRALEPFFTTKELGKGTGLGLAMVYGVVKAHRATLELRSEPGRGTCVSLRFPAWAPAGTLAEAGPPEPAEPVRKALALLVVDDDELMQDAMGDLLGMLGHGVSIASRGEEALAFLEAGRTFDGVLLDVNMPGLGGVATLHRLRALRPDLPVLLVTGKADQVVVDLAATCPGVALLPKPYTLGQLRQQLQAWE